jgi:hypothetical protein
MPDMPLPPMLLPAAVVRLIVNMVPVELAWPPNRVKSERAAKPSIRGKPVTVPTDVAAPLAGSMVTRTESLAPLTTVP